MSVGVVIIGRNEGERFQRCLRSLVGRAGVIVYVDSGSTDGSVALAESFAPQGVHAVRLDMSTPFTAARARNAGLAKLLEVDAATTFAQFVDGDCEVREGWLQAGAAKLAADASLGAVSGRLRERFPEKSVYNRLADLEWDRPVGEEKSCGGVAMMRVEAVQKAGGFDPTLIAGEEPELCARMRSLGYRVWRIPDEMAWHDIAMTSRRQWLTRARRHGHAIIEVSYYKTPASRGLFANQVRSALIWGAVWPAAFAVTLVSSPLLAAWRWSGFAISASALLAIVLLLLWHQSKMARLARGKGLDDRHARTYARLLWESKGSQVAGMLQFLLRRRRNQAARVIDYREAGH